MYCLNLLTFDSVTEDAGDGGELWTSACTLWTHIYSLNLPMLDSLSEWMLIAGDGVVHCEPLSVPYEPNVLFEPTQVGLWGGEDAGDGGA